MEKTNKKLVKVAIVGPESTGKSTMSKYLAEIYDSPCVPEYSRYYCANLNRKYVLQDELNMYYGQIALEDALTPLAKNILIFDTTILTVKIWCDHLFGETPQEVITGINAKHYDLYLLMDIDLPWEDDPLRDFPNEREHFMEIWKQELKSLEANFQIISGSGQQRLKNGLYAVESFFGKQ